MKKLIHRAIWPLYLVLILFFTGVAVMANVGANSILRDHTALTVPIELVDTSTRTKKGHTSTTYDFVYRYEAGGQEYSGEYSAVNDKGLRYVNDPSIEIAYSNSDPTRSGALHVLKRQGSFGGTIKRVLIGSAILGVLSFFLFAFTAPKDPSEDESEASRPAEASA